MPRDRGEQLLTSLKTILQELTGGTHFLVVYHCPRRKIYQGVASQSWLPVLRSEELSQVLHAATNTIPCDPADFEWCQKHCSSLENVFKNIPRKFLQNSLTHLKWAKIRQKAKESKTLQLFKGTGAFFGAATEKRVAMNANRDHYKPPLEQQCSLVNAQKAWRNQGAGMPANHVSFEEFLAKNITDYTPNDMMAALGLTLQHYNPNHFDTNEPSKDLTMAFQHLARSWNMECHEKELARPGADDDDSDGDTPEAQSSCPRKVWLALVNGVLFPMSTMKSTPFNVNSHSQRSNSASFRGPSGNNLWAVFDNSAEQQRPSESSASGSKKPSPHTNFQAWCVQNKHLLLSQDQLAALKGCAGPVLFKEVNQRLRTASNDEVQAWKNQYKEYLQSVTTPTSLPSSGHAPAAGGSSQPEANTAAAYAKTIQSLESKLANATKEVSQGKQTEKKLRAEHEQMAQVLGKAQAHLHTANDDLKQCVAELQQHVEMAAQTGNQAQAGAGAAEVGPMAAATVQVEGVSRVGQNAGRGRGKGKAGALAGPQGPAVQAPVRGGKSRSGGGRNDGGRGKEQLDMSGGPGAVEEPKEGRGNREASKRKMTGDNEEGPRGNGKKTARRKHGL